MPKKLLDEDGLPRVGSLKDFPQIRDGFGRTQPSANPRISGAASVQTTEVEYRDPSLETFRQGISHWSRFNSIYRQVASLKRKWPTRTAPELLTNILLNQRQVSFQEQLAVMGGKLRAGGGVLDFYIPARGLAINVHGAYFHTEDVRIEWLGLIGEYVMGMRIDDYKYIFDTDLYRYEDGRALDLTLAGLQIS